MNWTEEIYNRVKHLLAKQRGNVEIENFTFLQALAYINKNGCCWRGLPTNFGNWSNVSGSGQRKKFSKMFPKVGAILFLSVTVFAFTAAAQDKPKVDSLGIKARFITRIIADGSNIWFGTEDNGVYCYSNDGNTRQYTTKDGLGDDNAYALTIDKLNRLWVGHLHSGVSVFNAKEWKNYDVIDGPIGERIFDIQTCPVDGDVWMATSAGITRYKIDSDAWEHYTREDGLPEEQVSSLAFQKDGILIAGTQCHGLAVFNRSADGKYSHSKNITAPERFGIDDCSPVPLVPKGEGLPSNQINQVLVTKEGTVWIATSAGLAECDELLQNFHYTRGRDYAEKVRGLYGGAPKEWQECPKDIMEQLLPEDYVTCLAEDDSGTIWFGTRRCGFTAVASKTGQHIIGDKKSLGLPDNYVSAILPLPDGTPFVGLYGGGAVKVNLPPKPNSRSTSKDGVQVNTVAQQDFPKLPKPIKPPTIKELRTLYYDLKKVKPEKNPLKIVALNDDWRTQGDWIDRYGKHSAVFCAQAGGGLDFFSGYLLYEMKSAGWIGRNYKEKNDQLRRWVHWLESNDKRVLQCLALGGRKQAEWNDHKEVYPLTLDGPHIYGTFQIPPGKYLMSLYFFNKDGHSGNNRLRDYILSVKTMKISKQLFEKLGTANTDAEKEFAAAPGGAKSRICDFWGGVYKRFYVEVADGEYVTLRLDSNYAFNTIISGVFFDPVGEMKPLAPLNAPYPPPRKPTNWAEVLEKPTENVWWGANVLDQQLVMRDINPVWFYKNARCYLLPGIRAFVDVQNEIPTSPDVLHSEDKEWIRSDIRKSLNYLQFFSVGDLVDYTDSKFESYLWEGRTAKGRSQSYEFNWNGKAARSFMESGKKKQTW